MRLPSLLLRVLPAGAQFAEPATLLEGEMLRILHHPAVSGARGT